MARVRYLNVFAFCAQSQRWAVAQAAGVEPLTCPPMTLAHFHPGILANRDLLYFGLHGIEDQPFWYGNDFTTAMDVNAFDGLDLSDTVVFVAGCHFTHTPFLDAIQACNPRFVVGGEGPNYTRGHSLVGPHLLGYLFVRSLNCGLTPRSALALAKAGLRVRTRRVKAAHAKARKKSDRKRLLEDIRANTDALAFASLTGDKPPGSRA